MKQFILSIFMVFTLGGCVTLGTPSERAEYQAFIEQSRKDLSQNRLVSISGNDPTLVRQAVLEIESKGWRVVPNTAYELKVVKSLGASGYLDPWMARGYGFPSSVGCYRYGFSDFYCYERGMDISWTLYYDGKRIWSRRWTSNQGPTYQASYRLAQQFTNFVEK